MEGLEFPITRIDAPDARELFAPGGVTAAVDYLTRCAAEATAGADVKTKKGQDTYRSAAADVSKSKVALDKAGKALIDGLKAQVSGITEEIAKINAGRGEITAKCDALRDATRLPLTQHEQTEAARIALLDADIAKIENLGRVGPQHTAAQIRTALTVLERYHEPDLDWEEYANKAEEAYQEARATLQDALVAATKAESDAAAVAKLRGEIEARDRADAARLAEEKRQRELKEAADRATQAAEERARAAAAEAVRKVQEAEERAKLEANAREQAAAQAIRDAEEAAKRAAAAQEAAVQAERARAEAERKAEADKAAATLKAAALTGSKKHREKIHEEIRQNLNAESVERCITIPTGQTNEVICACIKAIADGKIPHLSIQY